MTSDKIKKHLIMIIQFELNKCAEARSKRTAEKIDK